MTSTNSSSGHIHGLTIGKSGLLAAMASDDLQFIAARGSRRIFDLGQVIKTVGSTFEAAYFIESGVASVVRVEEGERKTEICLVGPEGFLDQSLILVDGRCPYEFYSQTASLTTVALPRADFLELFHSSSQARALIYAAIYGQTIQIAENLVSATWQNVAARVARWLLMYRDRMRSDRIEVTHAFIANMIGAQRTKVTEALHELESDGAFVATRGLIHIRNAGQLEAAAGAYYGLAERYLDRTTSKP